MKELDEIRAFAFKAHADTNHMYGGVHPYSVHLAWVAEVAERYMHLATQDELTRNRILATAYLHDSMEDARLTYNDVKQATGSIAIAEAVRALTTNPRGRTRKERFDEEYYRGIREDSIARYVKLCDRIANMEFGLKNGGKMLNKYRKEMPEFLEGTGADIHFPEMAEYLRSL